MKQLLVALNILLLVAIVGIGSFWNPQPEEAPLPGTYAEKLGRDILVTLPATPSGAMAASQTAIEIIEPYVPLLPPGTRTGAAYLRLRNTGARDVMLISAASPAAALVELHGHTDDAGVLRMRRVKEVVIPANQEVALRPGGLHLMLIDLRAPLQAGTRLPIRLDFSDGGSQTIEAIVRPASP